jgi:serine/threonine protein kinase
MRLSTLGRYQLARVIGQGAMGIVYEGRDPHLDRRVAIKTVQLAGMGSDQAEEFEARFLVEARSAARLQHPHIVTLYDADRDLDTTYLVLEFVQGHDLRQHMERGARYSLRQIADLLRDLLDALGYAHDRGIVHRDVKPANLLLDSKNRLKLTDFGIARVIDSGEGTRTRGHMIGTLRYMSPEQVQGHSVDARTDLYAAGVVLYQLLTGVRPFEEESDYAVSQQIVNLEPEPPSAHNPLVPPALDAVVLKALAKLPQDRYEHAHAFRDALDAALADVDVDAAWPAVPAGNLPPLHGASASVRTDADGSDEPLNAAGVAAAQASPTGTTVPSVWPETRQMGVDDTTGSAPAVTVVGPGDVEDQAHGAHIDTDNSPLERPRSQHSRSRSRKRVGTEAALAETPVRWALWSMLTAGLALIAWGVWALQAKAPPSQINPAQTVNGSSTAQVSAPMLASSEASATSLPTTAQTSAADAPAPLAAASAAGGLVAATDAPAPVASAVGAAPGASVLPVAPPSTPAAPSLASAEPPRRPSPARNTTTAGAAPPSPRAAGVANPNSRPLSGPNTDNRSTEAQRPVNTLPSAAPAPLPSGELPPVATGQPRAVETLINRPMPPSPEDACANLSFFARQNCLSRQCQRPVFQSHAYCVERARMEERRYSPADR